MIRTLLATPALAVTLLPVHVGADELTAVIETRRKYLKYHDLHHLMTRYSVGRIGEGEVSAWELGTGKAGGSVLTTGGVLLSLATER